MAVPFFKVFFCGKVTASNFSVVMANEGKPFSDAAKRYALQVALERINNRRSDSGFSGNEHTERGHEQEKIARALYEMENFVNVDNGGFFDHGLYGDSPDGLVGDDGVIEIKSVIAPVHYATLKRGSFDQAYTWQLIGHLDCCGRSWVDFVSYCAQLCQLMINIRFEMQFYNVFFHSYPYPNLFHPVLKSFHVYLP